MVALVQDPKTLSAARTALSEEFRLMEQDSAGPGMGGKRLAIAENVLRTVSTYAAYLKDSEPVMPLKGIVNRGRETGASAVERFDIRLRARLAEERRNSLTRESAETKLSLLDAKEGTLGYPEGLKAEGRAAGDALVAAKNAFINRIGFEIEHFEAIVNKIIDLAEGTPLKGPEAAKDLAIKILRTIQDRGR